MKNIALDTNIFSNIDFINFLIMNSSKYKVFIPSIVGLELGYFRALKNISWEEFNIYLEKFNATIMSWDSLNSSKIIKNAVEFKTQLPFAHHFRDFIIGTQCAQENVDLITYNKDHYFWVSSINIFTPDTFFISNMQNHKKNLKSR